MIRRSLFLLLFLSLLLSTSLAAAENDNGADHLDDARSLYQAGHWDDAHQAFQKAYQESDPSGEFRAAAALEWGGLLWEQGTYGEAERLVREALELARALGRDDATGQLLVTLGHIEAARGDLSGAENTLNICVQLTGELGDAVYRSLCRLNRRVVRTLRGRDPGSEAEFRSDIEALQNSDAPLSVGTSLAKTAQLYMEHRDLDRAETLLNEAQQAYQRAGSVPAMNRNRLRIVQLLHRQGNFDEAAQRLPTLLAAFETMRNRPMQIQALAIQAEAALHGGNRAQALSIYRRALSVAESIEDPQLQGRLHLAICEMEIAASPAHCQSATALFRQYGMPFLEIRAHSGLGRVHQRVGDRAKALQAYRAAVDRLESTVEIRGPHRLTMGLLMANICQVEIHESTEAAFQTCSTALSHIASADAEERERYQSLRANVHYTAGRAAIAENKGTSALNHLDEAARLFQGLRPPQPLMAADVLLRRGIVQANIASERPLAAGAFEEALSLLEDLEPGADVLRTQISLLNQLAQLHLADEEWTEAMKSLERLQPLAARAGDTRSQAWALSAIARVHLQSQRRDAAREALQQALPLARQSGDQALIDNIERNLERL